MYSLVLIPGLGHQLRRELCPFLRLQPPLLLRVTGAGTRILPFHRPRPHPQLHSYPSSGVVISLNATSPIPAGQESIIPALFPCFCEL